jgi:LacI family transcriptional regulator
MASRRRVILLIETNSAYGRGLLSGISRFARVNGAWTFCYEPGQTTSEVGFSELRACRADGVIVRAENSQMAAAVARLRLPTVELRGAVDVSNAVSVLPDTKPLVEMALEHLLSRRLPNFAFCGYPGVEFSDQRQQAFIRFVESRKINYHLFPPGDGAPATNNSGFFKRDSPDWMRLLAWIASLPRPIGILAANDARGPIRR